MFWMQTGKPESVWRVFSKCGINHRMFRHPESTKVSFMSLHSLKYEDLLGKKKKKACEAQRFACNKNWCIAGSLLVLALREGPTAAFLASHAKRKKGLQQNGRTCPIITARREAVPRFSKNETSISLKRGKWNLPDFAIKKNCKKSKCVVLLIKKQNKKNDSMVPL